MMVAQVSSDAVGGTNTLYQNAYDALFFGASGVQRECRTFERDHTQRDAARG